MFSYGWKILVAAIACSLSESLRSLIIGKRFSSDALGYYDRGRQVPQVISSSMTYAVQGVMLPAMSEVQDKAQELKQMLKRTVAIGSFLIMPAMFGLAAVAVPVVKVLFSDKWLPSVPYLQMLGIADACIHILTSNLTVIKASGRSDVFMKLEFARRAMIVSVLCISVFCFKTVEAIAVGYCVSSWLDSTMTVFAVKRLMNIPVREQFLWVWKTLFASVAMLLLLLPMAQLQIPAILLLLLQIVTGAAVYLVLSILLKNESVAMIMKLLRSKKK
jgi:O-antigen/teichoic acid export membrane protein